MILLDTSGLLAAAEPRILSPFVLAEFDYLLATRVSQDAELALLDEVARGVYRLVEVGTSDVRAAAGTMSRAC